MSLGLGWLRWFAVASTFAAVFGDPGVAPAVGRDASPCNGLPALCDRPYDEVAFATTHNAMSNADDGWIGPNQQHGLTRQLQDGIRALMLDVHSYAGRTYLCHGYCWLGKKLLADGLGEIRAFLDANPQEVVTIIFESYVSAAEVEAAFAESELLRYAHEQDVGDPWPALGEMIADGHRLVVFTDKEGGVYPWYHDVWQYAWETDYANKAPSDFSCDVNRGSTASALFILNHFLTNPIALPSLAEKVNHNPFFLDRAQLCKDAAQQQPNFVTVDFYSIGDVLDVVLHLNATATVAAS
ncbi:MAG: hypothetical protein HYV63_30275 [Candidatus Schekmanbacteria bacterium]|nr:hypothetical protein [Candidatus Schekmanbacteria bacterium]